MIDIGGRMIDIGNDLRDAYDDGFSDGYRSALQEVEYQVERLSGEYEDLGLTPEQIKSFLKDFGIFQNKS